MNALTIFSATTFLQRLRGLLGRSQLKQYEALHITPCNNVHSFGMKYALDILFLDKKGTVIKQELLNPNKWLACKEASSVIEFKSGCAKLHGFSIGEKVPLPAGHSIGERVE